jgi:hypothetical protein
MSHHFPYNLGPYSMIWQMVSDASFLDFSIVFLNSIHHALSNSHISIWPFTQDNHSGRSTIIKKVRFRGTIMSEIGNLHQIIIKSQHGSKNLLRVLLHGFAQLFVCLTLCCAGKVVMNSPTSFSPLSSQL